ncbi:hypothetical protein ACFQZ4_02445 [Catellatospora coxensis]
MNIAARPQHHPSAQPAGIDLHLRAQWSALTAPTEPAVEFTSDMAADLPARPAAGSTRPSLPAHRCVRRRSSGSTARSESAGGTTTKPIGSR